MPSAQISDPLDKNLDSNTFELTEIGFGSIHVAVPAHRQHYETTVDVTVNGHPIEVQIEAGIRTDTGQVYATFQTIDPQTGLPPDVTMGFLPPNDDTTHCGEGYVAYVVQLPGNSNLATGTQIRNVAAISFRLRPAQHHRPARSSRSQQGRRSGQTSA